MKEQKRTSADLKRFAESPIFNIIDKSQQELINSKIKIETMYENYLKNGK